MEDHYLRRLYDAEQSSKALTELVRQLVGLSLVDRAWISALHSSCIDLLAKESGKRKAQVKTELHRRQKAHYKKLVTALHDSDNWALRDIARSLQRD